MLLNCDIFLFDIIFRMFSKHDNFSGIVTKQDMTNTTLLTLGGAINVKKLIEQNVHTTKIENISTILTLVKSLKLFGQYKIKRSSSNIEVS
jgi:hypothetical protein